MGPNHYSVSMFKVLVYFGLAWLKYVVFNRKPSPCRRPAFISVAFVAVFSQLLSPSLSLLCVCLKARSFIFVLSQELDVCFQSIPMASLSIKWFPLLSGLTGGFWSTRSNGTSVTRSRNFSSLDNSVFSSRVATSGIAAAMLENINNLRAPARKTCSIIYSKITAKIHYTKIPCATVFYDAG